MGDLRGLAGLGLVAVVFVVTFLLVDDRPGAPTDVIFLVSLLLPPYVLGRLVRRLADQAQQRRDRQAVLQEEAVREERIRLARELHDVIAHSVTAMLVQAEAAREVVATDGARAAALLDAVTETGRQALDEIGRLLHLLRDRDDELGMDPARGPRDVPELVERFRAGGLDVTADLDLPTEPVPPGVDVSAYRIVQELLTNARRHAVGPSFPRLGADEQVLRTSCTNPLGPAGAVAPGWAWSEWPSGPDCSAGASRPWGWP